MPMPVRSLKRVAAALLVSALAPLWHAVCAQTPNPDAAKVSLPSSLAEVSSDAIKALADRLAAVSGAADILMSDGLAPTVATPAGLIASAPMVLLGRASLAAHDAAELIAWMKATGSAVRIGHGGGWSASHACALQIQELVGSKATLVAATPGTTPLALLKTDNIDLLCEAVPLAMSDITTGAVTAYILASEERVGGLWDLQTADQAGLPLFSASVWLGLYAATADDAKRPSLNAALQKVLSDDDLVQALTDAGWTLFPLTHRSVSAHAAYATDDAERIKSVFATADITAPMR